PHLRDCCASLLVVERMRVERQPHGEEREQQEPCDCASALRDELLGAGAEQRRRVRHEECDQRHAIELAIDEPQHAEQERGPMPADRRIATRIRAREIREIVRKPEWTDERAIERFIGFPDRSHRQFAPDGTWLNGTFLSTRMSAGKPSTRSAMML